MKAGRAHRRVAALVAAWVVLSAVSAAPAQAPAPGPDAAGIQGSPAKPLAPPLENSAILYPRQSSPPAPAGETGRDGGPGSLVVVIALAFGVAGAWLLWRKLRGAGPAGRGEHRLVIAETRPLGNRQFLVVATYGEQKLLLGVCPGRVSLLTQLEENGGRQPPQA